MSGEGNLGGMQNVGVGKNESIVEEIKSRCNIVDVIGRNVVLKKAGSNYKGVCPFHNEKTPSFVVSETKQIFTCFGCGATGDVIEFIKRYYSLDFQEAIEKLAGEYGIEVKRSTRPGDGKRDLYYEINRQAANFFYRAFTTQANPGYAYMKRRGMDPATLQKFGIGYADGGWDTLYRYFVKLGVDVKLLLELGLVSESKGKYFDKFRNRVMFPIVNTRGKVVGFGGRAIGDGTPKYLNSPESEVFLKKNNLYGLNLTRQDINKENCAILVEGYMDVISLYKSGVKNVSASLGTALTENQAALLKRYTENIVLSYDADAAGQAAALRGLDILRAAGCRVKVLHVTDGKDPDEFVKKNGKEAFLALTKQAKSFADYKIDILRRKFDLESTEGRIAFLQEAARVLRELSPVEADVYVGQIARETGISEGAIRREVGGLREEPEKKREVPARAGEPEEPKQKHDRRVLNLEMSLIRLMLFKSSYIPRIGSIENAFSDESCRRIYDGILGLYDEDSEIDLDRLRDGLEDEENSMLAYIMENIQLADVDEAVFADCTARIRDRARKKREKEILQILSLADENVESEVIEALTRELMDIQREMKR